MLSGRPDGVPPALAAGIREIASEPKPKKSGAVQEASGIGMYRASRFLVLFGAACLAIVMLTHVAETFGIFPSMGWGQPNSAGHYLDLASAILGCTLSPIGLIASFILRRKIQTEALPATDPQNLPELAVTCSRENKGRGMGMISQLSINGLLEIV
jgi:formate hydrogenlyase subunit 3/multisubunit Na+/H+ antiporter MnhD subunit